VPGKTAEILAGLRAVARPRDRLGRMQLLLLALGLIDVAGVFLMVLVSRIDPTAFTLAVVFAVGALGRDHEPAA